MQCEEGTSVWPSVHLLPLLEHSCGPARALRREHGCWREPSTCLKCDY